MNMMNKCAKFYKDSPSGKKVQFNLARAIELSETAVFVYNFVQKPYASEQLRWHIWPAFPLNFLMKFSQKMPLYFFYTMVQKSQKWPITQIKGGSCLKQRVQNFLLLLVFFKRSLNTGRFRYKIVRGWNFGHKSQVVAKRKDRKWQVLLYTQFSYTRCEPFTQNVNTETSLRIMAQLQV